MVIAISKKLTKNIEGLPIANNSQKLSNEFTFDHPEKSFEVANKYQNPSGMCYAVTMARVAKAFTDMNFYNVLKVAAYGDDYIYSGTISKNIPDKYFGYGVGGALEKKGYADLITTQEIWDGKLEEGAILQYWNNPNKRDWKSLKEAIKLSIGKKREDWPSDFRGGHSVIFKEYILDDRDNVVALWCYDYSGIQKRFEKDDESAHKIFLGANLRDK